MLLTPPPPESTARPGTNAILEYVMPLRDADFPLPPRRARKAYRAPLAAHPPFYEVSAKDGVLPTLRCAIFITNGGPLSRLDDMRLSCAEVRVRLRTPRTHWATRGTPPRQGALVDRHKEVQAEKTRSLNYRQHQGHSIDEPRPTYRR